MFKYTVRQSGSAIDVTAAYYEYEPESGLVQFRNDDDDVVYAVRRDILLDITRGREVCENCGASSCGRC